MRQRSVKKKWNDEGDWLWARRGKGEGTKKVLESREREGSERFLPLWNTWMACVYAGDGWSPRVWLRKNRRKAKERGEEAEKGSKKKNRERRTRGDLTEGDRWRIKVVLWPMPEAKYLPICGFYFSKKRKVAFPLGKFSLAIFLNHF